MTKSAKPNFNKRSALLVFIHITSILGFMTLTLKFGGMLDILLNDHLGNGLHETGIFQNFEKDLAFVTWSMGYLLLIFALGLIVSQIGSWGKTLIEKYKKPGKFKELLGITMGGHLLGFGLPLFAAYFTVDYIGSEAALDNYLNAYIAIGVLLVIGLFLLLTKQYKSAKAIPYIILLFLIIAGFIYIYIQLADYDFHVLINPFFFIFVGIINFLMSNKEAGYGLYLDTLKKEKNYKKLFQTTLPLVTASFFISIGLAWLSTKIVPEDFIHEFAFIVFGFAFILIILATFRWTKSGLKNKSS